MSIENLQENLAARGHPVGAADGRLGPLTYAGLCAFEGAAPATAKTLGQAMAVKLGPAGIASRLQIIYFVGQWAEETEGYKVFVELGGPKYFQKYDWRKDLGNTEPGDGFRFRGRGPPMLTGRFNYRHYGAEIGQPLEITPDLAADPAIGIDIACHYWNEHHIGPLADADNIEAVTRAINGGLNGLADRTDRVDALKHIWPE